MAMTSNHISQNQIRNKQVKIDNLHLGSAEEHVLRVLLKIESHRAVRVLLVDSGHGHLNDQYTYTIH